jgi:hypothetical protein
MAKLLILSTIVLAIAPESSAPMCSAKGDAPHAGGGGSVPQNSGDEADGWITVKDHRPMYLPDECGRMPVWGYMLGRMEMNPSSKNVKDDLPIEDQYWVAIVFRLTKPCKARSPEGDIREYPPGTEILVGGADNASLYQRADNATHAFEVKLTPTKQLALGGGRKMWLFEKKVNPTAVKRTIENELKFFEGIAAAQIDDPFAASPKLGDGNRAASALPPAQTTTAARS